MNLKNGPLTPSPSTTILFVCHGNICRSGSAEYIFNMMIEKRGLKDRLEADSAATSTEEIGNPIYPPMRKALLQHDVPIGDHRARQIRRADYEKYDLIIAMDEENMYYLGRILGEDRDGKIKYLMEYTDTPDAEIEDPWYTRNFEKAYQDIYKGCKGLLNELT